MQIPCRLRSSFLEIIFVRKFVCFLCRCFWYSATRTGPRQQRVRELISSIKTHRKSKLQIHTYEHLIMNVDWQTVALYYIIQARKIDIDFRGDSLVANKRTTLRKHYSWFIVTFLWSSFCIVFWRWLLAILLGRNRFASRFLGVLTWLIYFHFGSRLVDWSIAQR